MFVIMFFVLRVTQVYVAIAHVRHRGMLADCSPASWLWMKSRVVIVLMVLYAIFVCVVIALMIIYAIFIYDNGG